MVEQEVQGLVTDSWAEAEVVEFGHQCSGDDSIDNHAEVDEEHFDV